MPDEEIRSSTVELTAELVSAYVSKNALPAINLPHLIQTIYSALNGLLDNAPEESQPDMLKPAVTVKRSIGDDFIVCLEDGKRFKSLKRHLHAEHGMSPQDYRSKWGLPKDYPMVAPAYSNARSTLAKSLGLGRKASGTRGVPSET